MPPKESKPSGDKLSDDTAIRFNQENPKKKGSKSHQRYELYKSANTVGEALSLGAVKGDIPNDIKRGYCHLSDGSSSAAAVEPAALQAALEERAAPSPARAAKRAPEEAAKGVDANAGGNSSPSSKRRCVEVDRAAPETSAAAHPASSSASVAVPAAAPVAVAAPSPLQPVVVAQASPPEAPPVKENQNALAPTEQRSFVEVARPVIAAASANQGKDVDLSFAKLDSKPMKFVKRVMGEARRLLCPDGLEQNSKAGLIFSLLDRDNLSKWAVTVRDLNQDGQLVKDLKQHELDLSIDLEISLPDGYPLEPPFARVLYPQLRGGFVFTHGGICFEPLTAKGWAPSMTIPALAMSIKGILDFGDVRVGGVGVRNSRTVKEYTEEGARRDHKAISQAHRGGESSTYMRNIKS